MKIIVAVGSRKYCGPHYMAYGVIGVLRTVSWAPAFLTNNLLCYITVIHGALFTKKSLIGRTLFTKKVTSQAHAFY